MGPRLIHPHLSVGLRDPVSRLKWHLIPVQMGPRLSPLTLLDTWEQRVHDCLMATG